jgi:hypothetical protein
MASSTFGPWPLGIDNVSEDGQHRRNRAGRPVTADDCVNGDFSRTGHWSTRPGLLAAAAANDVQCFWSAGPDATVGYGRQLNNLVRIDASPGAVGLTVLAQLAGCQDVGFCEVPAGVAYCTPGGNGLILPDGTVQPLSVPDGQMPTLAPRSGVGGLPAGRYSVALAWVAASGRVGGLSPIRTVQVPDAGGIDLTMPAAPAGVVAARIYRTTHNGDVLYWSTDIPAGMPSYVIGHAPLGEQPTTRSLRAMPPGRFIRFWKGRLLIVSGRHLFVSEPMDHGLYHPRHRFAQFKAPIAFIEPVEGGVFVGLYRDTVVFLDGTDPAEWQVRRTGGREPIPGSSMRITADLLDPEMQITGELAVWLATNGYVLGLADGSIVQTQAQRIRLPFAAAGKTAVIGRRIITIVQ